MKLLYNIPKISTQLFIIYHLYYKKKFEIIKFIKKLITNIAIFIYL